MGIVPSTFKQATCTRLLLWFASLLLSLLKLMLMLLSFMELMAMLALLVPMELIHMLLPMELTHMPMVDMEDTVLDMPDMDMELTHMPMVDMDTHMPMELTTESDLLMLSQRLMLMLLSCTELMDM